MTPATRRTLIRHAVALDLVVIATGIAYLAPSSPVAIFGAYLGAVAISAWLAQEESGLLATAYSVAALAICFGNTVDATLLTAFAAVGATGSAFVRAARRVPPRLALPPAPPEFEARAPATAPSLPFTLGLPFLVLVVYTDISNTIMLRYPVPSLLQPIIAMLAIVVWKHRASFRPGTIVMQAVPLLLASYAYVLFSTTIWATDQQLADKRVGEAIKAVMICILAGSLAASWHALRTAMTALVGAAAVFSAISVVQVLTGRMTDFLGGMVDLQTGNIYGEVDLPRASGPPVDDPNFYARILLVAIPLAVALGLAQRRTRNRLAYFAAAAMATAGTLVTYSRGAMLAMAGMAVLMLFAAKVRIKTVALGAAGFAIVLLFLPAELIEQRLGTLKTLLPGAESTAPVDGSVELRKLFVRSGIEMFAEHPLFGVGAGQFTRHYYEYANIVGSALYDYSDAGSSGDPHSLATQIASESGLFGLATFGATLLAAFVVLWRSRNMLLARGEAEHAILAMGLGIAICGYLAASLVLHETHLRYPGLYLGFIAGIARLTRERTVEA
ncbi:MAG: O-antigen ligase family protein [Acidobacteria bacterium]|nr:O-antigen ligase family protein [Acidobacteriota bacterium]MBV9478301.1 O-antigen ligase family protein [Acidobacteriota bacterium]